MAEQEPTSKPGPANWDEFADTVGEKEERKLKARRDKMRTPWFWAGVFGLVGWSVSMPTVLGILLGVWIDRRWPSQVSWTLMLLLFGVGLGCLNAWFWVTRESRRDT